MAVFTVRKTTDYDIYADTVEEAREKWLRGEWDWELSQEDETCPIYDELDNLVFEP